MTDADIARTIIAANITFFLMLALWWFMNRQRIAKYMPAVGNFLEILDKF